MSTKRFSVTKGDCLCFLNISTFFTEEPGYRITLEMTPEEVEEIKEEYR